MNKDRTYCTCKDCLTVTCSRHKKHLPRWYDKPIVWRDFHLEGCKMYKSLNRWSTLRDDES